MNRQFFLPLFRSRGLLALLLVSLFLSSCLKDKDGVSEGRAGLAVVNLIVNGEPVNVSIDGSTITPVPVTFGTSSQSNGNIYLEVAAGIHSLRAVSGTRTVMNNIFSFQPGSSYSLLLYDTLKSNDSIKTQLLTDDLTAVDSVARARYFQCIPTDSLSTILVKDTLKIPFNSTYIGKQTDVGRAFNTNIPEGTYQLNLQRNNTILFQRNPFGAVRGKLYTFIVKGVPGGTGSYAESILVLQHN